VRLQSVAKIKVL